jgi:hypothetical protein
MAGIYTPGTTGGTVPGTVPVAVRKVVRGVVWAAVGGVILTVSSVGTGKVIDSITGEVSQSVIREGTCGRTPGATRAAIRLVILRAPVHIQRRH